MVKNHIYNVVRDYYLEKDEALTKIRKFFNSCKREWCKPVLYYTGHGEVVSNHLTPLNKTWNISSNFLGRLEPETGVLAMEHSALKRLNAVMHD